MAGFESIDAVRALSISDVTKLTNPQLKKALQTLLTAERAEEPSNSDLLNELRDIQGKLNEINAVKRRGKMLIL